MVISTWLAILSTTFKYSNFPGTNWSNSGNFLLYILDTNKCDFEILSSISCIISLHVIINLYCGESVNIPIICSLVSRFACLICSIKLINLEDFLSVDIWSLVYTIVWSVLLIFDTSTSPNMLISSSLSLSKSSILLYILL